MSVSLRPYQVASIEQVRSAIRAGKRRIMLTIPTGGGKTFTSAFVIVSALAKAKRCLFVAHRKELIDQTVAAFLRLGVTDIGVIRAGDKRRNPAARLQIASIQTLARRTVDGDFDVVVIDEGHRSVAKSYTVHLFERYPRAVILALSATPIRSDGRPLASHFDALVIGALYSELLASGAIVEPRVYSTPILPDLSSVRTTAGEFNQEDLEAAVNKGALIGNLLAEWQKHPPQRTVVFAVSVRHSRAIVETFRAAGVTAEHLDGTTPEAERTAILARLASGESMVVSNVGVLCEGWDLPSCKTLILARPTKSLGLYMQMGGRIFRPWEDVTPIVLDHGGNVDRHGLPHVDRSWSLEAKPKKTTDAPTKICKACYAYVRAGAKACPYCGHVFEATPDDLALAKTTEPIPIDLALRTLDAADVDDPVKLREFRALHRKCRDRGWKLGAAIHRYEERFGEPPPKAWIDALKSDARKDAEWKDRIKKRLADQGGVAA
ncbi:MAG: box helicase [Labilithrix sp.]|nr:box helicase [Labilithrix sp.]